LLLIQTAKHTACLARFFIANPAKEIYFQFFTPNTMGLIPVYLCGMNRAIYQANPRNPLQFPPPAAAIAFAKAG
jgi:hypothetical protein